VYCVVTVAAANSLLARAALRVVLSPTVLRLALVLGAACFFEALSAILRLSCRSVDASSAGRFCFCFFLSSVLGEGDLRRLLAFFV